MTRKNKSLLIVLLLLCVVLVVGPVFALRGAEFGGSDDAGSIKVAEITGEDYEPVSYTHLDVYKRQALYQPFGNTNVRRDYL